MESEKMVVGQDKVVHLDYVLTVEGEIADSTAGREPLPYLHGHNNLIKGLEVQLEGMQVGEGKTVTVDPENAYGVLDDSAFMDMEKNKFPENFEFNIGRPLRLNTGDGRIMSATISEVKDDVVVLDFNHPLAGKSLTFEVSISDIREATEIELSVGRVDMGGCASCSGSCDSCG
ncbi:MAG TPA: peptidylprolyl isomerase [Chloroflexi bacterium]|nr:peptidylprolyl isomerase [Chloroflexota bacterium]